MKRPVLSVVSLAIVSMIALTLIAAQPTSKEPSSGLLSNLKKGQAIVLKDLGTAFEITIFPNRPDQLGYEVVEVGNDFVAVQDLTGLREVRIPVYAVKSITTLKVGEKRDG